MREQVGLPPADPRDVVTKGYVDQASLLAAVPQVGWYATDSTVLQFGTGSALVSGKQTYHRLFLGPATYDALAVNVLTAQTANGAVTLTGSLYPDDGTDGWPDTSTNPLQSAQFAALTSTGYKLAVLPAPLVVTRPIIYWVGVLWLVTTAPGTAPVLNSIANNIQSLGRPSAIGLGTPIRGYTRTGLTAPANTALTPANVTVSGGTDITGVAIRRSA